MPKTKENTKMEKHLLMKDLTSVICSYTLIISKFWLLLWLFLVASLTMLGMNYHSEHTCIQILRLEDTEFWSGTWIRMIDTLNPDFEARRHTFNLCHTFCWKPIYKDKGRKKVLLFILACLPHLVCTSIVSLALEPTALWFQQIQKSSWDTQPRGTEQL